MNRFLVILIVISALFLSLLACTIEDDNPTDCLTTSQYLLDLKFSIEDFAAQSVCGENFECRSIAFGSKPCGGPWSFLTYSTSIDTLELMNRVNEYNGLELSFNINCGAISDCSVPIPPSGFSCENNQCIPIF